MLGLELVEAQMQLELAAALVQGQTGMVPAGAGSAEKDGLGLVAECTGSLVHTCWGSNNTGSLELAGAVCELVEGLELADLDGTAD